MKERKHTKPRAPGPRGPGDFRLPPDILCRKQSWPSGWAYVFRHRLLGEVGRILVQDAGAGRTHIACEVVGDPADPQTAARSAVFQPLGLALARQLEGLTGSAADPPPVDLPLRPAEPQELIESSLIACVRCGTMVAMLIFAPRATDAGGFEDYARKMYPEYTRLNVQTWIIGPALGGGPLMERPAEILKVWPAREPIARQRPADFNALLDQLVNGHCGLG